MAFDEHPGQHAHRRSERQGAHQGGLDGQHQGPERQEHQDRRRRDQQQHHQRQPGEQAVDAVLFQCRGAADAERLSLGRDDGAQFVDLLGGVVADDQTVLDHPDRRVLGGAVEVRALLPHRVGVVVRVGEPVDRHRPVPDLGYLLVGDRLTAVGLDHQRDGLGPESGEDLVDLLLRQPDGVGRGQILLADAAQGQFPERRDHRDHDQDDRDGEHEGPLHHPVHELAPEAVLHFFAGLGLLGLLGEPVDDLAGERPVGQERNPQQGVDAQGVDVGTEDGKARREHGDGQHRRQHHRGDDRVGDRLQEALREQQQRQ